MNQSSENQPAAEVGDVGAIVEAVFEGLFVGEKKYPSDFPPPVRAFGMFWIEDLQCKGRAFAGDWSASGRKVSLTAGDRCFVELGTWTSDGTRNVVFLRKVRSSTSQEEGQEKQTANSLQDSNLAGSLDPLANLDDGRPADELEATSVEHLRRKLREKAEESGLSYAEIGQRMGIHDVKAAKNKLNYLFTNATDPGILTVQRFCQAVGCSIQDLLDEQ